MFPARARHAPPEARRWPPVAAVVGVLAMLVAGCGPGDDDQQVHATDVALVDAAASTPLAAADARRVDPAQLVEDGAEVALSGYLYRGPEIAGAGFSLCLDGGVYESAFGGCRGFGLASQGSDLEAIEGWPVLEPGTMYQGRVTLLATLSGVDAIPFRLGHIELRDVSAIATHEFGRDGDAHVSSGMETGGARVVVRSKGPGSERALRAWLEVVAPGDPRPGESGLETLLGASGIPALGVDWNEAGRFTVWVLALTEQGAEALADVVPPEIDLTVVTTAIPVR
jgi:hypothetical protein